MKLCLVVDASRVIRTVARRILEGLSYSADEAEDGMAGLRACREKMPDLSFLDWNLPSMKGLDFIKSVRGQQGGGRPVILFCTTESDQDALAGDMAAGANAYLLLPFDGSAGRDMLAEFGVAVCGADGARRFPVRRPPAAPPLRPGAGVGQDGADARPSGARRAPLWFFGCGGPDQRPQAGAGIPGGSGARGHGLS